MKGTDSSNSGQFKQLSDKKSSLEQYDNSGANIAAVDKSKFERF